MANELVRFDAGEFDVMQRMAKAMVASGYFNDVKDIAQAIVKIQAGKELGLPPFAALTGVHIIKNKPVLGANLIATLIKNDARYDYRVLQLDDTGCVLAFYEHGELVGEASFTAEDARKAGLNGDNWKKFPRNMYFARAISNGAKWYTPGIFGGAAVYTPDELGAEMDEEGAPVINVTPPARQVDTATGEITEGVIVEFDDIPSASNGAGETPAALPPADDAHVFYGGVLEAAPWYGAADAVRETMAALGIAYPDTAPQARAAREQLVEHAQQEADKEAQGQ